MDLKFAKNITSRISTVNLERQLLHALMSDKINLQRSLGKHKVDFFTNESRVFIYDCICKYFNDKHVTLNKEKFDFEVQKRFNAEKDKQRIEDYNTEFDNIKKTIQTEDIDGIINSLEEVQLANDTDNLIREAYAELEKGNYEEAANLLRQKSIDLKSTHNEGRIINLHEDSDDWFEEVRNRKEKPEQYAGIPTGFEKFDKLTGGLFPAELTIVFGLSGKGKSTFMKALSCNLRQQGRVVLHCGNEENEFQMRSKYMSADSGEQYKPFKTGSYTDEEYKRLKMFSDNARGVGAIYIYEFPQQTDATWIERAYRALEMKGVHVDVIVIDYLDLMKPINKAYSENDEQGKVTSDLKQVAINCHCPVITATQAGTSSEKQERKEKPFLTAADVFGTKRKVHSANTLIGIVNRTATAMANELSEEERTKHRMVLCVPKNRDGATFTFRQIMDVTCGKFYEDTEDDDPVVQNLEKQAGEMCDDTLPPDKMRSEIDTLELQRAKSDYLNKKVENINNEINNDTGTSSETTSEEDNNDDFLSEAPDTSEIEPTVNSDDDSQIEDNDDDDFLSEAPDSEDSSSIEEPTWESYNKLTETTITGPSIDNNEKQINIQENNQSSSEEPKNENKEALDKKLSDKIPHKMSLNDLLKKNKK